MGILKLLLAFAPWLAFLFIAHGGLLRLKIGLAVALLLSVVMGLARLHRGVILWVGLVFFTFATVMVLVFQDMWAIRHMGVLASGALALGSWLSVALRRPFTLEYAKEHTDASLWNDPLFIHTNMLLTSLWATVFSLNTLLAWGKMHQFILGEVAYELVSYALLVSMVLFTNWYPAHVKRARGQKQES